MRSILDRIDALLRLGIPNLARVGLYRIGLRTGTHPVLAISAEKATPPFFKAAPNPLRSGLHRPARWLDSFPAFGLHRFPLDGPPNWNSSPFDADVELPGDVPWNRIGDFDSGVSDIKAVWEASRFDWVLAMAQRAALGESAEGERLNAWLADWALACAPFYGANWKCGQEAAIRLMHLATAAMVLGEEKHPLPGLEALIVQHCERIAPTMGYARGQDNNHGTSEAAALFIGGSWLAANGDSRSTAWYAAGRDALEERCVRLIDNDGTFSQYSVTYHRVMLDTLSLAETWRKRFGLPPFTDRLYAKLRAAAGWLRQMTDPETGDAPNLGANDGAMLMQLSDTDYRDFRPSVQWASALFSDARAYPETGSYDRQLAWLGLASPETVLPNLTSETFDDGGLHVLRSNGAAAYLRYPRFRFRPSQSDLLHCDLWVEGRNILRDSGTFSYAASPSDAAFLASPAAHNTVQFDNRDQMPKVGRFLYARWPEAFEVQPVTVVENAVTAAAAYRDWRGAMHHRRIRLDSRMFSCTDILSGHAEEAVIRWRLAPGDWSQDGMKVTGNGCELSVSACGGECSVVLTRTIESRYYLSKAEIPVVEIRCACPATILTEVSFR